MYIVQEYKYGICTYILSKYVCQLWYLCIICQTVEHLCIIKYKGGTNVKLVNAIFKSPDVLQIIFYSLSYLTKNKSLTSIGPAKTRWRFWWYDLVAIWFDKLPSSTKINWNKSQNNFCVIPAKAKFIFIFAHSKFESRFLLERLQLILQLWD